MCHACTPIVGVVLVRSQLYWHTLALEEPQCKGEARDWKGPRVVLP